MLLKILLRVTAVLAVAIVAIVAFLWAVITFLWEVPRQTQETLFAWVAAVEGILLALVTVLLVVERFARKDARHD